MPVNENAVKANIKAKLTIVRENVDSADEALDVLVDAIYEVVKELLTNATITGICGGAGAPLTSGKIT